MTADPTPRVVIDCDTGTDDAAALLWLATDPGVEVVAALATFGNCDMEQAAHNTLVILEAGGCAAPVHPGGASPIGPAPPVAAATILMGSDGLGDVGAPAPNGTVSTVAAAEALVQLAHDEPGRLTLLCTAPLTTVATALTIEPTLPSLVRGITVMGGAVAAGGNSTAAAEANFVHDPVAAAAVIDAFGEPGVLAGTDPPRLVPVDVTMEAGITETERDALGASPRPGSALLHSVLSSTWDLGILETGGNGLAVHDLLAAFTILHPEVCVWELLPVAIDTAGGAAWGASVVDRRLRLLDRAGFDAETRQGFEAMLGVAPTRWSVATAVHVEAFRAGLRDWLAGDAGG